jgi:hypothetical protein
MPYPFGFWVRSVKHPYTEGIIFSNRASYFFLSFPGRGNGLAGSTIADKAIANKRLW